MMMLKNENGNDPDILKIGSSIIASIVNKLLE